MNMYLYGFGPEKDRDWIIVDVGVSFGDMSSSPGIDLVMPDIEFIHDIAGRVKAIFITLMYGPGLPGCYLISFLFFVSAHWIDRHNLLRRLAPPPRSPEKLIGVTLTVVLPLAILLHLVRTLGFYAWQHDCAVRFVKKYHPFCPT